MPSRPRFRGIKKTPKNMEKEMLATSQRLADDPSLVIPVLLEEGRRSPFAHIEKGIAKVLRYRDDPERLIKLASKGDQFVRAYAAAISLAASGKLPYLTTATLPIGPVSFAIRGTVDKEKLIGLQHFDDPDLRLLAYWDMAREARLHIYSTEGGLFASVSGPKAPEAYVKEVLANLPYRLEGSGCGHGDRPAVRIQWLSANVEIRVCAECGAGVNTAQHLMARVAAPDPYDDLRVSVDHRYGGARPECQGEFPTPASLVREYLEGDLDDAGLITAHIKAKGEWMRSRGQVYVLGQECYGKDGEAFLGALKGTDLERTALRAVLSLGIPIVTEQNQAGKVIGELWEAHARTMLTAVSDEGIAQRVLGMRELTPGQMLSEADRLVREREVLGNLPAYSGLGPVGQLADSLAKAYRIEGTAAMLRLVERTEKEHTHRAVCYAFLTAVGEAQSRGWQFNKEERESGEHLARHASRMLSSTGEGYHEALSALLAESGSGEVALRAP